MSLDHHKSSKHPHLIDEKMSPMRFCGSLHGMWVDRAEDFLFQSHKRAVGALSVCQDIRVDARTSHNSILHKLFERRDGKFVLSGGIDI
jgi:hypothetical protein